MRLITGGIIHETHTFSREPTTVETFVVTRGEECRRYSGTNDSLGGVIAACRARGIELVPTLYAVDGSTGTIPHAVFEALAGELLARVAAALPADGVVLTLHGAMVVEGFPDAEGELAHAARELVGPNTPIAITLDLHANIGPQMVANSDIVVGYDTYPHTDANERAQEAVALLADTLAGRIRPAMALVKPPLLPVPQAQFTARQPMRALFERAFALEASGAALSITIAGGFPYSDVPIAGMSFLVVTNGDQADADALARELAGMAWERRTEFGVHNVPPAEAVSRAIALATDGPAQSQPARPVVLVDVGDNIGGGTPGDGTVLLAELLRQGAREATVVINDPAGVSAAFAAGVGGPVEMAVGGKTDDLHGPPLPVRGRVRLLCDGEWVHEGPESAGVPVNMGLTALVRVDGVNLLLTSRKTAPGDLQQLKSVGIDPLREQIIVVKAAVRWRGGYGPITRHSIDVDTPGLGSVDLARFSFRQVRRPIWPLDPDTDWRE